MQLFTAENKASFQVSSSPLSIAILGMLTVGGSASAFAQDKINLSIAHVGTNPSHHFHYGFDQFAKILNDSCDNQFNVVIHQGTMGGQRESIELVQEGVLDMTSSSLSVLGNFGGSTGVFDLPYLFADREQAYRALDSKIGKEVAEPLKDSGLRLISYWENGFRNVTNNRGPIETPNDLKDLSIRVPESNVYVETFEALGANPTTISFSEVFSALQQGVIDAQENPYGNIWDANLYEVQDYLSETQHVYAGNGVVINNDRFMSLDKDIQKCIIDAASQAKDLQRKYVQDQESELRSKLIEQGMKINKVKDINTFIEKAEGAYEASFYETYGKDLIERIRAVARGEA
ncbi:TRAP transporter substrate-binding protein [Halomonas sp. McH1-25]|uniref:TRAP transporter substrate-binding protein n=1 Tax=unclassified Halomonas TaxID=2609666 RepID=UPI001EF44842|nr:MULTISPECIES: TRAP transporter substrate-binding protein [unclassified Halomonas]MCG7602203.1 TRAP transporter substrate-binding protein [Halomonas sp. McH1-25]MCP1344468.1 TRAP transporter substrate-binding protein [Halomonas sp. FL8]MCP1362789.1 TRAP transporter substrate-binding protein [Halomonas sp. BBD45]MCP1363710.1 TRAP transporter substrate-binding protein [Halomonas sp. BBD48]